jgi:hypothetical protein
MSAENNDRASTGGSIGVGDAYGALQIDSRAANLVRRKFLILFHFTSPLTMPLGVCAFWKRPFAVGPLPRFFTPFRREFISPI